MQSYRRQNEMRKERFSVHPAEQERRYHGGTGEER